MAKFDKMVDKFNALTDPKEIDVAVDSLIEITKALKEAVSHYEDQEKLNNPREVWYSNARASYEDKLEKVDAMMLHLLAKKVKYSQEVA